MNLDSFVLAQADVASGDRMIDAIAIAIVGTVIVFAALSLISIFIASLPRILQAVSLVWPEVSDWRHEDRHPESRVADDTDVLAAIGFVLHTEFQKQLAVESATDKSKVSS